MYSKTFNTLKVLILGVALSLGLSFVYAWSQPTVAPPGGNATPPLNTGATTQIKLGDLQALSMGTGIFRMTTSPVAGWVLTSNVVGTAAWTDPATLVAGSTKAPNYQVFDASDTWIKPTGYGPNAVVLSKCWGGGGGGSSSVSGLGGGSGGGGGGYVEAQIPLSSYPSSYPVVIGAGGTGGVAGGASTAPPGNATTFKFTTANGGGGARTTGTPGSVGGLGGGSPFSGPMYAIFRGGTGEPGNFPTYDGFGGAGGNAGGGGGSGGAGGPAVNGEPGIVPGGGGGGNSNIATGGAGAPGRCIITVLDGA